jgi:hypothetical protein
MSAPYTALPARLASALRARPDGWPPADVDRIGSALALYPEMRAAIGAATVNGLDGDVWMEPTDTGAMLSVYGPFGALLYREEVRREA